LGKSCFAFSSLFSSGFVRWLFVSPSLTPETGGEKQFVLPEAEKKIPEKM
jgi:hypothetical protein